MGKLVGYRLRPGVAAETWLAFALDTPPDAAARPGARAGQFRHRRSGQTDARSRHSGSRACRVPTRSRRPSRLVEPLADARAAWNAMPPWLSEAHLPVRGERAGLAGRRRHQPQARRCPAVRRRRVLRQHQQRRLGLSPDHRRRGRCRERPHARCLGARPGRIGSVLEPARAAGCVRHAQALGRFRQQRADVAQHGSAVPQRLRGQVRRFLHCRRMAQLHHHAEYRRAPRPGRSISTRSSPRSRPMFRVTSRGEASPCSPRAASTGRTKTFRAAHTSSFTA